MIKTKYRRSTNEKRARESANFLFSKSHSHSHSVSHKRCNHGWIGSTMLRHKRKLENCPRSAALPSTTDPPPYHHHRRFVAPSSILPLLFFFARIAIVTPPIDCHHPHHSSIMPASDGPFGTAPDIGIGFSDAALLTFSFAGLGFLAYSACRLRSFGFAHVLPLSPNAMNLHKMVVACLDRSVHGSVAPPQDKGGIGRPTAGWR